MLQLRGESSYRLESYQLNLGHCSASWKAEAAQEPRPSEMSASSSEVPLQPDETIDLLDYG